MKKKKEQVNILITTDDNYLEHAIDLLYSIKQNNDFFINLYLIYNDLSYEGIEKIKTFLLEKDIGTLKPYYLDLNEYNLPIYKKYMSKTIYCRLFAPFIIDEKIDRILYLDCDIICTGNISGFYNSSFGEKIIVACENLVPEKEGDFNGWRNMELDLPKRNFYINSGVLLINVNKYKKFTNAQFIINYIENYYDRLFMHDQDILNKLFFKNIKKADIKYNYQINSIDSLIDNVDCRLVHYSEQKKPWNNDYCDLDRAKYYYRFLKDKGDVLHLKSLLKANINNKKESYIDDILNNL